MSIEATSVNNEDDDNADLGGDEGDDQPRKPKTSKLSASAAEKLKTLELQRKQVMVCAKWEKSIATTAASVQQSVKSAASYPDLQGFADTCRNWLAQLIILGPKPESFEDQLPDLIGSAGAMFLSPNTKGRRESALNTPKSNDDLSVYEEALKGRLRDVSTGRKRLDSH